MSLPLFPSGDPGPSFSELLKINDACMVNRDQDHFSALCFKCAKRFQDGRVLSSHADDPASPRIRTADKPLESKVICLCRTARENDLITLAPKQRGNFVPPAVRRP